MNNKGFIATSLIYSFFLVFVAVMASILATYAHNRILVNNVNEGIVDDLNATVESKYLVIENMIRNSDFEEDVTDELGNKNWEFSNAAITEVLNPLPNPLPEGFKIISYRGMKSVDIRKGNSEIKQDIHKILGEEEEVEANPYDIEKDHYYYLRYYIFRNGSISGSSSFTLEKTGSVLNFNLNYINTEIYANWDLKSDIVLATDSGSYTLRIVNTNINGDFVNLNIDSLMLIDVTELVEASGSVPAAKDYLDTFDYFEGPKSITKP